MIGIVDCGTSNLRSVENVFEFLKQDFKILKEPEPVSDCSRLVIPGVGTFAQAMGNLREGGLDEAIRKFADTGKPILGICLGMQLLADQGTEPSDTRGLGLVPGKVVKLSVPGLRIPHVGWNTVFQVAEHPFLTTLKKDVDFYFVHSFHFEVADSNLVLAQTDYGGRFASVVGRGNVVGTQFHPEKSQKNGLKLLKNFLKLSC